MCFHSLSQHTYKVKVINPHRKSDMIIRYLHNYSTRFESATALRMKLVEEFQDLVPDNLSFSVGYFEGQSHSKIWLMSREDFATMYVKYPKGEITLWCDSRTYETGDTGSRKKRKKDGETSTKRQAKEDEVDDVFMQLKEKHGQKFDIPRLRLWARTICGNLHDDFENPPDLPAFRNETPKKAKHESLSDALTGAAVVFAHAFKGNTSHVQNPSETPVAAVGLSPSKAVELHMKNFEQLRYLQQLYEDGILTTKEFEEQKDKILSSLRKLN